jgi:hypothetical protein
LRLQGKAIMRHQRMRNKDIDFNIPLLKQNGYDRS